MLKLVFLDFDGTVMAYDETGEYLHPAAVALLHELADRGIAWCTNSGRDVESQRKILEDTCRRGLARMPEAILSSESLIFHRRNGGYIPDAPWNRFAHRRRIDLQAQVARRLEPLVPGWLARFPFHVMMGEHYTVFRFDAGATTIREFHAELLDVLAPIEGSTALVNGDWVLVHPVELGKGNLVRRYLRTKRIEAPGVLCVGDYLNDLSMLDGTAAGLVGCPGSAISEVADAVRRAGGYVAGATGPEGTCEVIRHFLDRSSKS